jgi:2-keto-4-pentenoate hydratase
MTESYDRLAERLALARLGGGLAELPTLALAEGYDVARRLAPRLGPVLGWKVGATSGGAMAFLKVDAPIYGRLFTLWADGATIDLPGNRPVEVEPEILFVLGPDLLPLSAHFGVEFNRPSFADPFGKGAGAIVADNAASLGVLIGPSLPLAALDAPEALVARLEIRCGHWARCAPHWRTIPAGCVPATSSRRGRCAGRC